MCDSGGGDSGAGLEFQKQQAEEARKREEERQARIKAGMGNISTAFKGFDDAYYQRFGDAYRTANQPALLRQQDDEQSGLLYNLARSGLQNGSVANERRADVAREQAERRGQLEFGVADVVGNRRKQVADTRAGLETQLRSTEDADAAAANATAQVRAIDKVPGMDGGAWLTPVVNTVGTGVGAYNQGREGGFYREMGTRLFPGSGSVRTQG